jgi:hypothetical protein
VGSCAHRSINVGVRNTVVRDSAKCGRTTPSHQHALLFEVGRENARRLRVEGNVVSLRKSTVFDGFEFTFVAAKLSGKSF